ncbi:hypothetical protein KDA82_28075 [Streptomyces daliensis]|uniref:TadE-like protein n=1 Tax=Streptomyces daliensis TaxID=299421 RepID=A0A8T4IYI5_9ACTN|nr:hypothetical protein [Streptomyces daliensis]
MTAEAAVVIPTLVLLTGVLLWGVMAAATQIQCVDGARAGARAAARGETEGGVRDAVRSAAPHGARVTTAKEGDLVRVRVRARTAGPGALTVELDADAVALDEASVGAGTEGAGHDAGRDGER